MHRLNKTFSGRDNSFRKNLEKRNKLSSSFRQDIVYPTFMKLEEMLNEFHIFQNNFMSYLLNLKRTKKMRQFNKKESKSRVKDALFVKKRSLLSCKKRRISSDWAKLNTALITSTPKFSLTQLSYFFNKNDQEQTLNNKSPALVQLVTSETYRFAQNKMDIAVSESSKTNAKLINAAQLDKEADGNLESTRIDTEKVEEDAFTIERMEAVEAAIVVAESLESARLAQLPVVGENEEQSNEEDFLEEKNETLNTRMDVNVNKNEPKRSGRKSLLTTENRSVVENFFEANNNPTAIDLEELVEKTGLKKSYLKNWFSNKRHDLKKIQKNTNLKASRALKNSTDNSKVEQASEVARIDAAKADDDARIEKQAAEKLQATRIAQLDAEKLDRARIDAAKAADAAQLEKQAAEK
jgi:hypothetical protein